MISPKLKQKTGTASKVLCALSLAVACAPAWTQTNEPRFEMAVFSDAGQGTKILSGKYDQAIAKIEARSRSTNDLHVQTNLCVAYVKSGDIAAAELACEEAVVAAKTLRKVRASAFVGSSPAQMRARYMAVTLSNRGVLKAIKGDLEAAREDFDAAMSQQARVSAVRTNMERLSVAEEESA